MCKDSHTHYLHHPLYAIQDLPSLPFRTRGVPIHLVDTSPPLLRNPRSRTPVFFPAPYYPAGVIKTLIYHSKNQH